MSRGAQSGFKVQPGEYEGVSCEREEETLMQRFLRLKEEVGQLVADVEGVKDSQESAEKLLQVSPADLLQDVRLSDYLLFKSCIRTCIISNLG